MEMNKVYSIWVSGSKMNSALGVEVVGETDKAIKFSVLNSTRDYTFFLPKAAVKVDAENEGILLLARWFKLEGFIASMFDRFSNYYVR